jgi:hypothetical protein
LFYDEGLELLIQARIFIDNACDCEVILYIIKCEKQNLGEKNKLLEQKIEKMNSLVVPPSDESNGAACPGNQRTGIFPRLAIANLKSKEEKNIVKDSHNGEYHETNMIRRLSMKIASLSQKSKHILNLSPRSRKDEMKNGGESGKTQGRVAPLSPSSKDPSGKDPGQGCPVQTGKIHLKMYICIRLCFVCMYIGL